MCRALEYGHTAAPKLRGEYENLPIEEIAIQITRGGAYIPKFEYLTDIHIATFTADIRNSFVIQLGTANV